MNTSDLSSVSRKIYPVQAERARLSIFHFALCVALLRIQAATVALSAIARSYIYSPRALTTPTICATSRGLSSSLLQQHSASAVVRADIENSTTPSTPAVTHILLLRPPTRNSSPAQSRTTPCCPQSNAVDRPSHMLDVPNKNYLYYRCTPRTGMHKTRGVHGMRIAWRRGRRR